MLFDVHCDSDHPSGSPEGLFDFIARAEGTYWDAVRGALSAWFAHYPADEREALRTRLFDGDDGKSQAAFWELLVHELYTAADYDVDVHPPLDSSDHRPDFRAADDESAFLLEARVVTATSAERRARDRRLRTLTDAINRARPENFYVKLEIVSEGQRQPPVAPILDALLPWLREQDADDVAETQRKHGFRGLPSLEIPTGDWMLRFRPISVDPAKRGKLTGPLIGVGPVETSISDPTARIRKALGKKGRHYGATRLPLVVALDLEELGVETGDIAAALFGKVETVLSGIEDPVVVGHRRVDDGYWSGGRNAGQRVAAVLTMRTPRPWNVTALEPHLWLNPWAPNPYTARRIWAWTTVDSKTGEFQQRQAGTSVPDLLGLPAEWPPGAALADATRRSDAG